MAYTTLAFVSVYYARTGTLWEDLYIADKGIYKSTQLPERAVCQPKAFRSPVLNQVFLEVKAERHKQ